MSASEPSRVGPGPAGPASSAPGGLLDVLGVAAVVLDEDGRIVLWSPQAEAIFGYTSDEALGRFAGRLLVHEEHLEQVMDLFAQVMGGNGSWAGIFPIRRRDGGTKLVEFRNMRLMDDRKGLYALGLASERTTLRRVERDWPCPRDWCRSPRSAWWSWTPNCGSPRSTRRWNVWTACPPTS